MVFIMLTNNRPSNTCEMAKIVDSFLFAVPLLYCQIVKIYLNKTLLMIEVCSILTMEDSISSSYFLF